MWALVVECKWFNFLQAEYYNWQASNGPEERQEQYVKQITGTKGIEILSTDTTFQALFLPCMVIWLFFQYSSFSSIITHEKIT